MQHQTVQEPQRGLTRHERLELNQPSVKGLGAPGPQEARSVVPQQASRALPVVTRQVQVDGRVDLASLLPQLGRPQAQRHDARRVATLRDAEEELAEQLVVAVPTTALVESLQERMAKL